MFQGKLFVYDKVMKPNVTQEQVYETAAKPIVAGKYVCVCAPLILQILVRWNLNVHRTIVIPQVLLLLFLLLLSTLFVDKYFNLSFHTL